MQFQKLEMSLIDPDPDQPRKDFHTPEDARLEASLRAHGQWVPLLVHRRGLRFVIVDGERRFRAGGRLGWQEINACILEEPPKEADQLLAQLVITCQRRDFNPLEKAQAYARLKAAKSLTNKQLAETLHVSPATVTQVLSILEQEPEIQGRIARGEFSMTGAYAIRQEKDPRKRKELAEQASVEGLSRSAIQAAARGKTISTVVCRLASGKITVASEKTLDAARLIELLQQAASAVRKAAKQGLDLPTIERVLADRAKHPSPGESP